MLRPVLITPPAVLPISLAEAKAHLRVDHDDEDGTINALIVAANSYLDGWTGILGRCLSEQVWRQDFDAFAARLALPLGPVLSVTSVSWRTPSGTVGTVPSSAYALRTDHGGRSLVRFDADYVFPAALHESGAVSVTYRAGYATIPGIPAVEPGEGDPPDPPRSPAVPARSSVPDAIRVAMLLLVAHWFEHREAVVSGAPATSVPASAEALLAPWRRVGV